MKKITLAALLLSIGAYAQTFPSPYCDIDPSGTTVEEITKVTFGDIIYTNADTDNILIDKTDFETFVFTGSTQTLTVEGNTVGNFDNAIVAFIDWNNNEILDDAGEIYEIGTLTNSTGSDGISVSLDIMIPFDAQDGETRVRITKIYTDSDSEAIIDPCAISFNPFGQGVFPGFGQALDFNLLVQTLGVADFDFNSVTIYPNPTTNTLYINSEVASFEAITITDINGRIIQKNITQNTNEIDVSNLQSGIYFLNLVTAEGSLVKKFIKQ